MARTEANNRWRKEMRSEGGIVCGQCGENAGLVLDTRYARGYIRRRRECVCGYRMTTHEKLVDAHTPVLRAEHKRALHEAIDAFVLTAVQEQE